MARRLRLVASEGAYALCRDREGLRFPLKVRGAEILWQVMWSYSSRAENGEIIKMGDSQHELSRELAKLKGDAVTCSGHTVRYMKLWILFIFPNLRSLCCGVMPERIVTCPCCVVTNMSWLSGALCRWLLSAPSARNENTLNVWCWWKNGQIVVTVSSPWATLGNKISLGSPRDFWH